MKSLCFQRGPINEKEKPSAIEEATTSFFHTLLDSRLLFLIHLQNKAGKLILFICDFSFQSYIDIPPVHYYSIWRTSAWLFMLFHNLAQLYLPWLYLQTPCLHTGYSFHCATGPAFESQGLSSLPEMLWPLTIPSFLWLHLGIQDLFFQMLRLLLADSFQTVAPFRVCHSWKEKTYPKPGPLPRATHSQKWGKSYRRLASWPQLGAAPKGCSTFRVPHWVDWCFHWDCYLSADFSLCRLLLPSFLFSRCWFQKQPMENLWHSPPSQVVLPRESSSQSFLSLPLLKTVTSLFPYLPPQKLSTRVGWRAIAPTELSLPLPCTQFHPILKF